MPCGTSLRAAVAAYLMRPTNSKLEDKPVELEALSAWSDFIAAIAGVIAALGVIGSLLFVGIQLRDQNREARLQSISTTSKEFRNLTETLLNDPDIASLYIRLSRDGFEGMDDTSIFRGQLIFQTMLRYLEDTYFQNEAGRLDERLWSSIERGLETTIGSVAFGQYWKSRGSWYSAPFQTYIEGKKMPARGWVTVMEER